MDTINLKIHYPSLIDMYNTWYNIIVVNYGNLLCLYGINLKKFIKKAYYDKQNKNKRIFKEIFNKQNKQ